MNQTTHTSAVQGPEMTLAKTMIRCWAIDVSPLVWWHNKRHERISDGTPTGPCIDSKFDWVQGKLNCLIGTLSQSTQRGSCSSELCEKSDQEFVKSTLMKVLSLAVQLVKIFERCCHPLIKSVRREYGRSIPKNLVQIAVTEATK